MMNPSLIVAGVVIGVVGAVAVKEFVWDPHVAPWLRDVLEELAAERRQRREMPYSVRGTSGSRSRSRSEYSHPLTPANFELGNSTVFGSQMREVGSGATGVRQRHLSRVGSQQRQPLIDLQNTQPSVLFDATPISPAPSAAPLPVFPAGPATPERPTTPTVASSRSSSPERPSTPLLAQAQPPAQHTPNHRPAPPPSLSQQQQHQGPQPPAPASVVSSEDDRELISLPASSPRATPSDISFVSPSPSLRATMSDAGSSYGFVSEEEAGNESDDAGTISSGDESWADVRSRSGRSGRSAW